MDRLCRTAPRPPSGVGWDVSRARTLVLAAPRPLRGVRPSRVHLEWAAKASADCLDFALDPSPVLADAGDTLVGASVTVPAVVNDTDLVVLWCTIIGGLVVIMTGGGQPCTRVPVQVTLTTAAGRRLFESVLLPIDNDSPATVPQTVAQLAGGIAIAPNAIALPDGSILTDSLGQPFILA
ncbi:hypothetical protein HN018_06970 [Lichenicola cladoniae]|uniref:Uncharacterized protein n=1 Tax=Lichenicola cladoniae TaxID=1484109 RepID=A0A6M8HNB2_9PROT|nr:hypothetical protein [Lichenicola cladoniae]NPD67315.1 hypothetical protein [Acetobacteraceae bacterium]QKE89816.1 hypothetical protein HN018_06970 [Lichenicola cladoniae]